MPGLLRAAARTAVVAGTATATANAVNRREARRQSSMYEQEQPMQAPAPAPVAYASQPSADDKIAQLERLAQLKAQGVLTEAEFAQQKATILGG